MKKSEMKEYYILIDNEKKGPYLIEQLKKTEIDENSLIWTEGLSDWTLAKTIEEIKELLKTVPPPIPKPPKKLNTKIYNINTNNKVSFVNYLKKNIIVYIILIVISLFLGNFIHNNYYDYLVNKNYGGFQNFRTLLNYNSISSNIIKTRDLLKISVWSIGLFLIPVSYLFKKK